MSKAFKKVVVLFLTLALILPVISNADIVKAAANNDLETAMSLQIGTESGPFAFEDGKTQWYRLDIPSDTEYEKIVISLRCESDFKNYISMDYCDANGKEIERAISFLGANNTESYSFEVNDTNKGSSRYLKVKESNTNNKTSGTYHIVIEGTVPVMPNIDLEKALPVVIGTETDPLTFEDGRVQWYKLDIPSDSVYEKIKIELRCGSEFKGTISMDFCSSTGAEITMNAISYVGSNSTKSYIRDAIDIEKGATYYLKIKESNTNSKTYGTYYITVTGETSTKQCNLSVKAKKGKKSVSVATEEGATVTISTNKAIIKKNGKRVKKATIFAGNFGKVSVKLSRKLKKGDKIKVSVKKDGFESMNITVTIK